MESITLNEKKLISEIINRGYIHAANSFSTMIGQKVSIETTEIELCITYDYLKDNSDHIKNLTVLQTDIIGQLQGSSYLIFNEDEKVAVSNMSAAAYGSNAKLEDAIILLEIDNILSAAVITELSNSLKLKIYGDVPKIFSLDDIKDLHTTIDDGSNDFYIQAHANFVFENHPTISPIFVWKMNKMITEFTNSVIMR